MKKIFVAMLALAAATACSNDELVSVNQEAIGFDNAFINNSVRSVVDPSYENTDEGIFADFQVYGYVEGKPLFNAENVGVTVSKTITNSELKSVWKYAGTQYWIAGAKYNFAAVAPATGWTKTDASKDGVTLEFTNDGAHDLLYAQSQEIIGKATGNEFVGFTFRHILSKVKFSFLNTYNADNTKLQVRNIEILDSYKSGSVALTASATTWTASDLSLDLSFGNAAVATADAAEPFAVNSKVDSYYERLLIPADYATGNELKVKFVYDIVVAGSVVRTFTVEPKVVVNLEPGHSYDFKATITPGEPIEFTVSDITDWDTDHNDDGKDNDETTI